MARRFKKSFVEKVKALKLIGLDVDGVLTDGNIYLGEDGKEMKQFNTKDGLGIELAIKKGLFIALVSGRKSKAVSLRAKDLGIKMVHQGIKDKKALLESLQKKHGIKKNETVFMGDDLPDLQLKESVSLFVSPYDAVKEVVKAADFVTKTKGGNGAVREWIDLVLSFRESI